MIDARRLSAATVVGLSLAVALSGCLSVPHHGRVQRPGSNATTPASGVPNEARIEAAPPAPGEEADEIVKDFYGSMIDYGSGDVPLRYQIAGTTRPWPTMPRRTVIVTEVGDPEPSTTGLPNSSLAVFVLHFTTVGEVLADHEFVAESATLTDTVDVVRDPDAQNEWRISHIRTTDGEGNVVPNVRRLSVADFTTVFHEATLYFPRTGKDSSFVADRRWFPRRRADLPATIAQAYVDGPSSFLEPDPTITGLLPARSSVDVAGQVAPGQAGLAFLVPADSVSDALRTQVTKAVQATFSQPGFQDITRVIVSVNGRPQQATPNTTATEPSSGSSMADAWFIDGRHVLRPWFDGPAPTDGAPNRPIRIDVSGMQQVSLSPNGKFAAGAVALADGRQALQIVWRDTWVKQAALDASAITSVRWTADGSGVWVAGTVGGRPAVAGRRAVAGKPAVEAVPASGGTSAAWFVLVRAVGDGSSTMVFVDAKPVALDPLAVRPGTSLVDLRPSPDGVRITAIVQAAGKKRSDLYVGRIDRSGDTPEIVAFRRVVPALLPPPKDKPTPAFTVAAAMWNGAEQLVLVARQGTSTYSLWNATFDGSDVLPRNTSGLVNISDATVFALARDKPLLALDNYKKRQVYYLNGGTWQLVSPPDDKAKVLGLLYPG